MNELFNRQMTYKDLFCMNKSFAATKIIFSSTFMEADSNNFENFLLNIDNSAVLLCVA